MTEPTTDVVRPGPEGHELRIVVGVDGSPCATRALVFAAHQAARLGAWLHVVCAYSLLPAEEALIIPMDLVEAQAAEVVARAVADAGGAELSVVTKGEHAFGIPGRVLVDLSEGATELVVGTSGLGGMLMGSVSAHVVRYAHCTTTLVR